MDRWAEISRLYHAVRNRAKEERAAFLSQACVDETLRCEVESLLRHENDAQDFLKRPAFEMAANLVTQAQQRSMTGRRLGPYQILSSIGAGGMGEVYRARDTRLKRFVAIKILSSDFQANHDRRARFVREAQAIAALNHPHICTIHDVGSDDDIDYLVMEYVEGQTLRERLEHASLTLDEARTIAIEVTDALSQAHQRGIVHRDVKPGNIMLTRSGAKLLDFGLAKVIRSENLKSSEFETATGVLLGTASYMSPEQLLGFTIDARSDVFSLGVVIYEMVTGARPFRGANVIDTIDAILHKEPVPISGGETDVPHWLQQVIYRCLEKERNGRYKSAEELLTAIVAADSYSEVTSGRQPSLKGNLPLQLTSFIGRSKETTETKQILSAVRLLTLTGAGGCGKTRLALHLAEEQQAQFSDGVWFVDLSPVSDSDAVIKSVASIFEIRERAKQSLLLTLVEYLASKQLLLVLDNCEHLVEGCAMLVRDLLGGCGGLKVLATSRQILGAPGEHSFRVPSLPGPPPGANSAKDVLQYEAVRLFVDRATAVDAAFQLTDRTASSIGYLCQRLDGIPLAIELAAARVRVLTVEEICDRLDDRFRLLIGGPRTVLPRHQTLRALLEWSYELLPEHERVVFRRLGVFAGGFRLSAAEAVCGSHSNILDVIASLAEKSLIFADGNDQRTRYRMLETISQYARDRLVEVGELDETCSRHAQYFLAIVEDTEKNVRTRYQTPCFDRLEEDLDNIRAALKWYYENESSRTTALRFVATLWRFWSSRGYVNEGQSWLKKSLENTPTQASIVRARVLSGAGVFAAYEPDYKLAKSYFEQFLDVCEELGSEAPLHLLRLQTSLDWADPSTLSIYERGKAIAERLGHKGGIAASLCNLGGFAELQKDYATARSMTERSVSLYREIGDDHYAAFSIAALGDLSLQQLDHLGAWQNYDESLGIFRSLGSPEIGLVLLRQAALAYDEARLDEAGRLANESLNTNRSNKHPWRISNSLYLLGMITAEEGNRRLARSYFDESLELRRRLGVRKLVAEVLTDIGILLLDANEHEHAHAVLEQSIEMVPGTKESIPEDDFQRARNLVVMGRWATETTRYELAKAHLREALILIREHLPVRILTNLPLEATHFREALRLQPKREFTGWSWHDGKLVPFAFEAIAQLSFSQSDYESATRLWAAANALRTYLGAPWFPRQRQMIERHLSVARRTLGDEDFDRAWKCGQADPAAQDHTL